MIRAFATLDAAGPSASAARALWQIRLKLGELFGWDRSESGLGSRVSPLTERLPSDLRSAPKGPVPEGLPFRALYLLPDEWAAEAANRTVHGLIHLGWVPEGTTYRAQMAILVKPNGPLGEAYMAAIRPFRYLVVYPALLRDLERAWRQAVTEPAAA